MTLDEAFKEIAELDVVWECVGTGVIRTKKEGLCPLARLLQKHGCPDTGNLTAMYDAERALRMSVGDINIITRAADNRYDARRSWVWAATMGGRAFE